MDEEVYRNGCKDNHPLAVGGRQILVSLLSTLDLPQIGFPVKSMVTTYIYSSERAAREKIPRGREEKFVNASDPAESDAPSFVHIIVVGCA